MNGRITSILSVVIVAAAACGGVRAQDAIGPMPTDRSETVAVEARQPLEALEADTRPLGIPVERGSRPPSNASREGPDIAGLVRSGAALLVVTGLLIGGGMLVRGVARRQGGLAMELGPAGRAPSGVLSVLGRYPVARGQSLVLLQLGTRVLLVNQSVGGRGVGPAFSLLTEITEADEVASLLARVEDGNGSRTDEGFQEALSRMQRQPGRGNGCEVVDLTKPRASTGLAGTLTSAIGLVLGGGR